MAARDVGGKNVVGIGGIGSSGSMVSGDGSGGERGGGGRKIWRDRRWSSMELKTCMKKVATKISLRGGL